MWGGGVGGSKLRRFFPVAVLTVPAIGFACIYAERHGLFGSTAALAICAMASTAVFCGLFLLASRLQDGSKPRHEQIDETRCQNEESNQLARFAVAHAGDTILWADMSQRIRYANDAACRSLGYNPNEILNLAITDFVPCHDAQRYQERLLLLKRGQAVNFESRHRRKDGTVFPVEVSLNYLEQEGRGYTCAIIRDITERKQAEESLRQANIGLERRVAERTTELRESRQRLDVILQGTGVATWDWEITTGKVFYNEQWALNRGLRIEDVQPHISSWVEGIHPDDRFHVERLLAGYLAGQTVSYECEMRIKTGAGEWAWIMDRGQIIERADDGTPLRMVGIELDITARKRAEYALRESQERYSSLVTQATDIIFTAGMDGRFTFVNAAACKIMGYQESELVGKHYLELIRPDFREAAQRFYRQQLIERTSSTYFEYPVVTKSGDELWLSQRVQLRIEAEEIVGVEAIARDVTERKKVEGALRTSEEKLRQALLASNTGIWDWNTETGEVRFSKEWKGQLGFHESELPDTFEMWESRLHSEDRVRAVEYAKAYCANPAGAFRQDFRLRHKDGTYRWIESHAAFVPEADGRRVRLLGSHTDITERKQAEAALQEAYDQLQAVTRRLTEAEEGERKRIARELHDEFGQVLTGLKLDLAWISRRLCEPNGSMDVSSMRSRAASMSKSVDGLIESVRATAASLRPSILDDLGPLAAIEWLVTSFRERTGLPCALAIDPSIRDEAMGSELASTLFRSTQELLTNVMRHAGASNVSVELTKGEGHVHLMVRDNGRGVHQQEWENGQSLGLRGISERVKLIGGTITIVGSPDKGTDVSLFFPVESHITPVAKLIS